MPRPALATVPRLPFHSRHAFFQCLESACGVGGAYSVVGLDERVVDGDDLDIVVLDTADRC